MMQLKGLEKPKIIVVVGPTTSGKSDLAVRLARKFNGEIISADSRQVYKGMNIGTGKITRKEMSGIKHYLLDVASPKKVFTVADFKKLSESAIAEILKKKKLPIICGGTGFYIEALVDNVSFPDVLPNKSLRKKLGKLSPEKLFLKLTKMDPARAKTSDPHNKLRLIRAIEIATELGTVPQITKNSNFNPLFIGIKTDEGKLRRKIKTRLIKRFKQGMIQEVQKLHKNGVSWKRLHELGLEYRYIARFLQKKLTREGMIKLLEIEIWHYAKRQMTWFRRDKRIAWHQKGNIKTIQKTVKNFL